MRGYTGEEKKVEKDEDKSYMTRKLEYHIKKMGEKPIGSNNPDEKPDTADSLIRPGSRESLKKSTVTVAERLAIIKDHEEKEKQRRALRLLKNMLQFDFATKTEYHTQMLARVNPIFKKKVSEKQIIRDGALSIQEKDEMVRELNMKKLT